MPLHADWLKDSSLMPPTSVIIAAEKSPEAAVELPSAAEASSPAGAADCAVEASPAGACEVVLSAGLEPHAVSIPAARIAAKTELSSFFILFLLCFYSVLHPQMRDVFMNARP